MIPLFRSLHISFSRIPTPHPPPHPSVAFALYCAETIMMCLAAVMPHFLLSIAGGAALFAMGMLVNGFWTPASSLPKPVWLYPVHYISFYTYVNGCAFQNEFDGTTGWGCGCADVPGGCPAPCSLTGEQVVRVQEGGHFVQCPTVLKNLV